MSGSFWRDTEIQPIEVHPEILETDWGKAARELMEGLARTELMTPDLSPYRDRLEQLGEGAFSPPAELDMASAEVQRSLTGHYDPATSPYYAGLRDEIQRQTQDQVSDMRRGMQAGGMLMSTPAARAEGDIRAAGAGQTASILGSLYDQERGRTTRTVDQAGQLAQMRTGLESARIGLEGDRIPQLMNISMMPRQMQMENIQMQSGLLGGLMDYQPWYTPDMYYPQSQRAGWKDLAGPLATAVGMISDRRLKKNIRKVGQMLGVNLYEYEYTFRPGKFVGPMAQEVEHIPGAVMLINGIRFINQAVLGIPRIQVGG